MAEIAWSCIRNQSPSRLSQPCGRAGSWKNSNCKLTARTCYATKWNVSMTLGNYFHINIFRLRINFQVSPSKQSTVYLTCSSLEAFDFFSFSSELPSFWKYKKTNICNFFPYYHENLGPSCNQGLKDRKIGSNKKHQTHKSVSGQLFIWVCLRSTPRHQ